MATIRSAVQLRLHFPVDPTRQRPLRFLAKKFVHPQLGGIPASVCHEISPPEGTAPFLLLRKDLLASLHSFTPIVMDGPFEGNQSKKRTLSGAKDFLFFLQYEGLGLQDEFRRSYPPKYGEYLTAKGVGRKHVDACVRIAERVITWSIPKSPAKQRLPAFGSPSPAETTLNPSDARFEKKHRDHESLRHHYYVYSHPFETAASAQLYRTLVDQLAEVLLKKHRKRSKARGYNSTESAFRRYCVFALETKTLTDLIGINNEVLAQYVNWLKAAGKSPSTIWNYVRQISTACTKMGNNRIRLNELALKKPIIAPKRIPEIAQKALIRSFAAEDTYEALCMLVLVLILVDAGSRPIEPLVALVNDVNAEEKDHSRITYRETKNGDDHTVWLSTRATEALKALMAWNKQLGVTGLMMLTSPTIRRPLSYHTFLRRYKKRMIELGYPECMHPRRNRATFISTSLQNGCPESVVRMFVGHRDARSLRFYFSATEEELKAFLKLHFKNFENGGEHHD